MLKKRIRFLTALALLLGLLTLAGCVARPLTAPLLLSQMRDAAGRQNAVEADVLLEGKAQVSYSGMDFTLPLKIKMNTQTTFAPSVMHLSGTVGSSVLGVALDLPLELYSAAGDGETTVYSRVDNGKWSRGRITMDTAGERGLSALSLNAELLSGAVLQEGTTLSDGKECRRVDFSLSGEALRQLLGQAASLSGIQELREAAGEDTRLELSLFIDAETLLPVHITARAENPVHLMEYTLDDVKIEIAYSRWGAPDSIQIPDDALNAPDQTNPAEGILSDMMP